MRSLCHSWAILVLSDVPRTSTWALYFNDVIHCWSPRWCNGNDDQRLLIYLLPFTADKQRLAIINNWESAGASTDNNATHAAQSCRRDDFALQLFTQQSISNTRATCTDKNRTKISVYIANNELGAVRSCCVSTAVYTGSSFARTF